METSAPLDKPEVADPAEQKVELTSSVRLSIRFIALFIFCCALYLGQNFFIPIFLSLLLAVTFSPIVQIMTRMKIPTSLAAAFILLVFFSGLFVSGTYIASPLSDLISDAPKIGSQLRDKLSTLKGPLNTLNIAREEVEKLANGGDDPVLQEVQVKAPSLLSRAADDLQNFFGMLILTVVLTFFLLTSRDMLLRKIIKVSPKLSDKRKALLLSKEIERDVSRYLLTVSLINFFLGMFIALSFWALGMPNPLLWGFIAALLNFLPYIGAGLGIIASAAVAIISFPEIAPAMLVPLTYLLLTMAEGQFITPAILGKSFSMNTVIILVSLAFWGFLWGPVGVFLAVPILITFKIMCEHIDGLAGIGEFISGEDADL